MMAAPTVHFSKTEARAVMKFLFLQGKGAAEIHGEMKKVLKERCPSYSTVKIWVSRFRTGHFEVTDEPRSGRPTSVTTEDKADIVHFMILKDRWISAKVIAETLGISRERVGHIIHNILNMRQRSAKWVPNSKTEGPSEEVCESEKGICSIKS
ncbi:protein GVQW3-like [Octopus sinensis]|uniref:Protein GVQW3-like n=1 Tax=Octopus sinensis TaxID=2607531 RepID=A0A6P7TTU6_9MOLL|nr:protein GVQW3-like [Octopus sinensis]